MWLKSAFGALLPTRVEGYPAYDRRVGKKRG